LELIAEAEKESEHSEEWLKAFNIEAEETQHGSLQEEQKRKMSIPRSGSIFSAENLKTLQHESLQQQMKRTRTTYVLLIYGIN
jgi:hypothetical protein